MKIKDENKRQQILTATASIITHEGAAAVSTTKVAKQVGIGQSSLYTYFTNKQALLSAVFAQEQQKLASLIIGAGVADDTLTIKARLMRYAQTMVKFAIANPDSLVIIEQIKFLPDFNGPSLNDPQNPIVQLFQMAIDAGALPKIDASLYIASIFAVALRHGENIQQQQYTEKDVTLSQVLRLIYGADFIE
ncbi:transcriptional regulator [Paucilactobacillus hokkaidonensis JCM 18461]|uniref:Transcriptional regulator n=2 Tax=Paucilactobacillus hokkaidonensis TaxID=1193095 RepID=A0A0A1H0U3_9LACO|nr:TetR/AcrR family transcriptional regulator [Paucilactobacillus hokkaidonensis]KRO10010.1 transcriptional regulator [Paucilactobacillus hokkaidonensis]BAP86326.1 transcriptional regulator [Paucilactobacillus hokkaidonensis JCM 18461]